MVDPRNISIVMQYIITIPLDYGLENAYLFGSFLKGKEKDDSDIDIALVLMNMPNFFAAQKTLMQFRRKIDLRIESHPIKPQDFN